jgi:hypothetical protein
MLVRARSFMPIAVILVTMIVTLIVIHSVFGSR